MLEQRLSVFEKYAKVLLPRNHDAPLLDEHPQIPLWMDILGKRKQHHLLIIKSSADIFNEIMLETLAQSLSVTPGIFQDAYSIYFDVTAFLLSEETMDDVDNDFRILFDDVRLSHKRIIFVVNQLEPFIATEYSSSLLYTLGRKLRPLLMNDQWRFIILTTRPLYQNAVQNQPFLTELFTPIEMNEPNEKEAITVLKKYQHSLENSHHVTITEEILSSAISLASTYLSGKSSCLNKAWELLDMTAARLNALPKSEQKPMMTNAHLAQVVSQWTKIPLSHLQNNKFQMTKLTEALQQAIVGQNQAIQSITTLLQNACLKLHKKPGPLCRFMLAGPSHVGKASLVYALAEQLFGHHAAVLRVHLNKNTSQLENIMVTAGLHAENYIDLYSAIQQTPYAILFFENIDQFSDAMNSIVKNILAHGYLCENNKKYDFRHAIIIISTTVGSDHIIQLLKSAPEQYKQMDLMQLVLNENVHGTTNKKILQEDIIEKILPELTAHFSAELLQHVNLIPFLPLNYMDFEKVIHHILRQLKKQLNTTFAIDIHYAPEVIKFLVHEVLWQHSSVQSLEQLLEQYLYSPVSSAVLVHGESRNHPLKKLILQLNENGQSLRCEWVASVESALYHL